MNFNLASSLLTTGAEGASGFMVILIQMLPLVLVLVIMYFMLIRPQRKKEKKVQEMRNSPRRSLNRLIPFKAAYTSLKKNFSKGVGCCGKNKSAENCR